MDSARIDDMSATCRECGAVIEHEHCHGTVIVHIGQRPECTEADCRTPEDVHGYTIDCYAVGCGCAGAAAGGCRALGFGGVVDFLGAGTLFALFLPECSPRLRRLILEGGH